MRQVYAKEIKRIEASTPTYYTKDDPIEPGKILVVLNLAVTWSDMKTTQTGQFYIQDGGNKVYLGDDTPARAGGHAYWAGRSFAGEEDYVGVFTPDSESADVISFFVVGELWDLKDWEKRME